MLEEREEGWKAREREKGRNDYGLRPLSTYHKEHGALQAAFERNFTLLVNERFSEGHVRTYTHQCHCLLLFDLGEHSR